MLPRKERSHCGNGRQGVLGANHPRANVSPHERGCGAEDVTNSSSKERQLPKGRSRVRCHSEWVHANCQSTFASVACALYCALVPRRHGLDDEEERSSTHTHGRCCLLVCSIRRLFVCAALRCACPSLLICSSLSVRPCLLGRRPGHHQNRLPLSRPRDVSAARHR